MPPDPAAVPPNVPSDRPDPLRHRPSQATVQDRQRPQTANGKENGVSIPNSTIRDEAVLNPRMKEHDPDKYFEIDKLLRVKRIDGKQHFLVKWKDGSPNSWQPEENISRPALRQYYATHTSKGKRRKRKPFKFFEQSQEAQQ